MQTSVFPEWQHRPFRLTVEEIGDPNQVLIRFFNDRTLPQHREILWELLSTAIGGKSAEFLDGKEVGELVFYCRQLEEFIEAVSLIQQKDRSNEID